MKLDNKVLFEASKLKLGDRLKFDFYDSPVTVMYNKDDGYHFIADNGKFFHLFIITDHNYVYYLETLLPTTEKGQTRKFTQDDLLKAMGLKIGDKVRIFGKGIYKVINTELDGHRLTLESPETDQWQNASDDLCIECLINSEYTVIPQPKYTLTETEKHIVLAIDEKWKWIARDKIVTLNVYQVKPRQQTYAWVGNCNYGSLNLFDHHFQFIQWTDEEPVSLDELREIAKETK